MTADTLPEALGRYRPLRILGQGAAGIVYLAQDPVLDRRVTVKVIRTDGLDAETRDDYLERFKVEAKAAGRCSHPGIVAIHDYAEGEWRALHRHGICRRPDAAPCRARPRRCGRRSTPSASRCKSSTRSRRPTACTSPIATSSRPIS
ncbi:MAG: hypothetical protein WDN69_22535 [Aliidongia sp.]